MKRKITAAPVVDENGKLTGAINLQDFYQAGLSNPSVPDVSPADAGWRRRFQRPRAGRPVMIILRQRLANHLSLEVLRRFAQIAASRQRQKAFRRRRG